MEKFPICRRIDGTLVIVQETLNKLQEIAEFDSSYPVALLSFIGGKASGKTTYTNLLIQNLRHNGIGGWLDKLDGNQRTKGEVRTLPGFSTSTNTEDVYSEVCLWPEVFPINYYGKSLMVLLLHVNYSTNDPRSVETDSLEVFLSLISSKIVEILWPVDQFRFLQIYRDLKELDDNVYGEVICKNVVYLKRSENKLASVQHYNGVESLRHMVSFDGVDAVLNDLKNVEVACIPNAQKPLLNSMGHLKLSLELYNAIYHAINLLADDEHIEPKANCGGQLVLGGSLTDFIQQCAENCNTIFQRHEADPIFFAVECQKPRPSPRETSPDVHQNIENETMDVELYDVQSSNGFSPDNKTDKLFEADNGKKAKQFGEYGTSQEQHDSGDNILQTLQFIVTAAEEKLPQTLTEWNVKNSNFKSSEVLAKCLQEACLGLQKRLDILKKEEINWLLSAATNQLMETNTDLCKIEDIVHSFLSNLTDIASGAKALHLLLRLYDLENEILQSNMLQMDFSRKCVLDICNNRILQYMNENRSTDVFLLSLEEIRRFYMEEMKRYLEYEKQIGRIFKQRLNADFNAFQKTNMNILNMVNKKLSALITKSKVQYDEKIVEAVNGRVSLEDLQNVHITAKDDALKLLKEKIQEVRHDEPILCHQLTLQAIIDSDWCLLKQTHST